MDDDGHFAPGAEILETNLHFVSNIVIGGALDRNSARLREALQARRHVDLVTIEITAFYHHVAEVDADTKPDDALVGLL
jgi:hypothetical protein